MRITFAIVAGSLALSACGGTAEDTKTDTAAKPGADGKTLAAGEYEVTSEITSLGDPAGVSGLKEGAKETTRVCIGEDGKPPYNAYMSRAGDSCTADTDFVRSGRIASSFKCERAGSGKYGANVDGDIKDGAFEAEASISTYFGNGRDYRVTRRLTGKRVGDCAAADAAPADATAAG